MFDSKVRANENLFYRVSTVIHVSWIHENLRWDEGKVGCNNWTKVCQRFLNATRNHEIFVFKPEKTRLYDFFLKNDVTPNSLAKKMGEFPMILFRNGTIKWSGLLQLAVNCPQVVKVF